MRSEAQRRCNVEEATHLVGGVLGGEDSLLGLEERLLFLMKNQGHKDRWSAFFDKNHSELLVLFELFHT